MDKVERKKVKVKKLPPKELTAADIVPDSAGRPVLYEWSEDDIKKIENMARIGMRNDHIAAVMGCSLPVLDRRIAESKKRWEAGDRQRPNIYDVIETAKASGDGLILKTMYQVATEDRHPTMLIWLSKARLGMREAIDVNADHKHTFVYETQLAGGILRQETKELEGGSEIIDALISEVTEEACPKESE